MSVKKEYLPYHMCIRATIVHTYLYAIINLKVKTPQRIYIAFGYSGLLKTCTVAVI